MKRIASPTFFGMKWYPMTLRPALPFLGGIVIWYSTVAYMDKKIKGDGRMCFRYLSFKFMINGISHHCFDSNVTMDDDDETDDPCVLFYEFV